MTPFLLLGCKSEKEKALSQLDHEISIKKEYDRAKEERINQLKKLLDQSPDGDLYKDILWNLVKEYTDYQADSAEFYAVRLVDLGNELESKETENMGLLGLLETYTDVGYFKEASDIQQSIDEDYLPPDLKILYLDILYRLYGNMEAYALSPDPTMKNIYRDQRVELLYAILEESDTATYVHDAALVELNALNGENPKSLIEKRKELLKKYDLNQTQAALQYAKLADAYSDIKNHDETEIFLAKSIVADIKNSSKKETTNIKNLALLIHEDGNDKRASVYINDALDNTEFFGSQQRKIEIGSSLPLFENSRNDLLNFQHGKTVAALIIAIFFTALSCLLFFELKNRIALLDALRSKYNELQKRITSNQILLTALLKDNEEKKEELKEAVELKNEYLKQALFVNSEMLNDMEDRIKQTASKLKEKKSAETKIMEQQLALIKDERQKILKSFDEGFLRLFPNFLSEINKYFKPEDRFELTEDGELTPDLRIFALTRLGISDPAEIAKILNLSVKTIYVYKTKLKTKSIIENNEFEEKLMKIKTGD